MVTYGKVRLKKKLWHTSLYVGGGWEKMKLNEPEERKLLKTPFVAVGVACKAIF